MSIHYRATPAELEIRGGLNGRGDGRIVAGIAVPFNEETEIWEPNGSYIEVIRRGAFAKTLLERGVSYVKFLVNHDARRRLPIGSASVLREDPEGLYSEFYVSETRAGDEALTLIRDGALDGLSIGFELVDGGSRVTGRRVEHRELKLREVSLVAYPAYSSAKVLAVRDDGTASLSPTSIRMQLEADLIEMESSYVHP